MINTHPQAYGRMTCLTTAWSGFIVLTKKAALFAKDGPAFLCQRCDQAAVSSA